jgi:hypothetical protein
MDKIIRKFIFLLIINLFLFSCVSIKPSTVELSTEVGQRIVDMQNSHQVAVSSYFDNEKKKVEDFLTETWQPQFLKNFMATSKVMDILKTDPNPENVIMDFAEAAHDEMQKQRALMVAPIDAAKLEATTALTDAYAQLISGQSTITARLEAATKRSQQQDELLGKLKLGDITNKATTSMVSISTKVQNALDKVKNVDVNAVFKTLTDALK